MKDNKIQKEKNNLQLKNKKKQKLKEKGITLIALVVTIIILLILAGVTLNMVLSGNGLFSRAKDAADKYKKVQEDEQELISDIGKEMNSEYVGAKITWNDFEKKKGENAYKVESSKSGAEEDQIFETEELGWRIWDYDGTTIRIISEKPTTKTLTLNGAVGYNNGVNIVNEICRQCYGQYKSNDKTERIGIKVANLRRSDIEKVNTYDYTQYNHEPDKWLQTSENEGNIKFGDTKFYSINNYYPKTWEEADKNWTFENKNEVYLTLEKERIDNEKSGEFERGDLNTTFKETYYAHHFTKEKDKFINEKYYDLIFYGGGEQKKPVGLFWLAGRSVHLLSEYCTFCLSYVEGQGSFCGVFGTHLYSSTR